MSVVYDEKLLDKTGLAMVPSAYKGAADENNAGGFLGKVYSVLPAQTTSDNLVTNGTFDTDSDWDYQTGWSIDNGVAKYDNLGTAADFRQNGIVEIGKTYILKFDTLGDVSGNFGYALGGSATFFNDVQPNQTYEAKVVSSGNDLRLRASGSFVGSIDNVSVRRVINGDFDFSRGSDATRVNKDGLVESVQIASGELIRNGGFDTTLSSELVQNGDFEQLGSNEIDFGKFDSQADVDTWGIATDNNVPRATKSLQDGFMRITYTANIGAALFVSQSRIPRNKDYKVTFRAKGTANANFVSIGGNNNINNNPEYVVLNPTLATDWQDYEFYVSHGDEPTFRFYLGSAQIGDTLDIDDIVVQEVGQNWDLIQANIIDGKASISTSDGSNASIYQSGLTVGNIYKFSLDISDLVGEVQIASVGGLGAYLNIDSDGTYEGYFTALHHSFEIKRTAGITNVSALIDNVSIKEVQGLDDWDLNDGAFFTESGIRLKHTPVAGVVTTVFYTPLTVGKNYKMTYEIKEINAGGVKLNTAVDVDLVNEVGTHVKYFEAAFNYLSLARTDPSNNDVVVDNISVVEVTNDTDIPRLDYSNSACPSLLLEPTRANKLLESENFNRGGSFWNPNNNSVSIESGYLAPDGTTNAYKITQGSNKASAILYTGSGSVLGTDARSIWAKTTGGTGEIHLCSHNLNTNNLFTVTENWQRFEVLGTTSTAGDTNFYAVDFRAAATNLTEVIIWGAQCEVGDYVTSYIPTRGTTITRLADVCDNAGDSTIFNDEEGVLYAEMSTGFEGSSGVKSLSVQYDVSNYVAIYFRDNNNLSARVVGSGNVTQVDTSYATNTLYKIAVSYNSTNVKFYVNGTQVDIETTNTLPTSLNKLSFDRGGEGLTDMNGKVKSLLYFNEALSDAELEYITSADIDLTVHNYKGSLSKISATYEDVGIKDRLTKLF